MMICKRNKILYSLLYLSPLSIIARSLHNYNGSLFHKLSLTFSCACKLYPNDFHFCHHNCFLMYLFLASDCSSSLPPLLFSLSQVVIRCIILSIIWIYAKIHFVASLPLHRGQGRGYKKMNKGEIRPADEPAS